MSVIYPCHTNFESSGPLKNSEDDSVRSLRFLIQALFKVTF